MATARACWIIMAGFEPTAFRSREKDDLLPTLRQLQRTQPDATIKWFERGRLWESPEAAAEAVMARRGTSRSRDRDWRPGGDHADPRAKYDITRDEKRARFKSRAIRQRSESPDAPARKRLKPPRKP